MIFSIQSKNFTEHDTFSYGISKTPLFKFQTLSAGKQFLQHRASYSKTVSYNVQYFQLTQLKVKRVHICSYTAWTDSIRFWHIFSKYILLIIQICKFSLCHLKTPSTNLLHCGYIAIWTQLGMMSSVLFYNRASEALLSFAANTLLSCLYGNPPR